METLQTQSFKCIKCSNTQSEIGEIRTTGGFWTKFFNIQNKKFKTVTCTNCKYTELYKSKSSKAGNILDFFGN
jgi:hypothetical protein